MPHLASAPSRRRSTLLPVIVIVGVVVAGVLASQSLGLSPSAASARHGEIGASDGVVPDDATVFDDVPAVTRLDPALLHSLRQAAADADLMFQLNSGWRSRAYQDQLLREAVSRYGSQQEARRWVATADTSPHVSGDAVDIGRTDAATWLSQHGAAYGLCQIYRNEPWHFELRPGAAQHGCPAMYDDPTHDPRMQR